MIRAISQHPVPVYKPAKRRAAAFRAVQTRHFGPLNATEPSQREDFHLMKLLLADNHWPRGYAELHRASFPNSS